MYSSTSITEHLELFRFTLSFCKKKKSLPTYPKFLDWVGRGQTNIFLNAAWESNKYTIRHHTQDLSQQANLALFNNLVPWISFWVFKQPAYLQFRMPTRQGKVREIEFFFKVREKSVNSVKWSGKLENLQKSGKSQEILMS